MARSLGMLRAAASMAFCLWASAQDVSCPADVALDEVSLLQHKAELPGEPAQASVEVQLKAPSDEEAELGFGGGFRGLALPQMEESEESLTRLLQLVLPPDHEGLRKAARDAAKAACTGQGHLLFVGILSAPANSYRRNVSRTMFVNSFRQAGFNDCIKMKYVIGHDEFSTAFQGQVATPEQMQRERELEEEDRMFGDLLRVPVPESYKSLPDKVLAMVSTSLLEGYKFVAKVDDDCIPDLTVMLPLITSVDPKSFLYAGRYLWRYPYYENQVGADGKFAPYYGGPTYLLSSGLADQIVVQDAQKTAEFMEYGSKSEDMDMGKWVRLAQQISGKKVRFEELALSYDMCGQHGCKAVGYTKSL